MEELERPSDADRLIEEAHEALDDDPARALAWSVRAAKLADGLTRARALHLAGYAARSVEDLPASTSHFVAAADAALSLGEKDLAGRCLMSAAGNESWRGDFPRAFELISSALDLLEGHGRVLGTFQLATIHFNHQDHETAIELYESIIPALLEEDDDATLGLTLANLGGALTEAGRLREAETRLVEARDINLELGRQRDALNAEYNLALCLARSGRIPEALRQFREADRSAERLGVRDPADQLDKARALLQANLVVEAIDACEQALAVLTGGGREKYRAESLFVLAEAHRRAGSLEEARRCAGEAHRHFLESGRHPGAAQAGKEHLVSSDDLGRPDRRAEALKLADELDHHNLLFDSMELRVAAANAALAAGSVEGAIVAASTIAPPNADWPSPVRVQAHYARGLVAWLEGSTDQAQRELRVGLAVLEAHRASLGATELRTHASSIGPDLARLGLRIALDRGDAVDAFHWTEQLRANVTASGVVRPPDDAAVAGALDRLRSATRQAETRALQGEIPDWSAVQAREQDLLSVLRGVEGDDEPPQAVIDPREIARIHDATLVSFFELDGELHSLTGSAHGLEWQSLGDAAQALVLIDRIGITWRRWIRAALHEPDRLSSTDGLLDTEIGELGDFLFPNGLNREGEHVLVVPTGALHAVPWSAIGFLTDVTVGVSPTAALWNRKLTYETPARVAAIAGPDLLFADEETHVISTHYPQATVMQGSDAQVGPALGAARGADVVHFATHGHIRGDNPMFSSLRLQDGPLTVFDLEQLDRVPRCVVMAACEAAAATVHPGDEVMGLVAALLRAGVGSVIASALPLADAHSVDVMSELHRRMAVGSAPARALAETRRTFAPRTPSRRLAESLVCFSRG